MTYKPEYMGKKILVVEDNELNAKLLAYFLEQNGFLTRSIDNGDHVLDQCHEFKPDMVLMDIEIHGISGADACIELRNDKAFDEPIFALTASNREEFNNKAGYARFDEYVQKPILLDDLLNKMDIYISPIANDSKCASSL